MFVRNPFKAREVFFYFCMFHKLRLGYAGTLDGGPGTEKRMISWQEFDKGAKTTQTSISCNDPSEGVKNIKCLNSVIAILKVHSNVESQGKHVDEVTKTLVDYCNGNEACSEAATNGIKDQCKNEDTPSKHATFLVDFICIKGTDTADMWEDNVTMKDDKDLLYVISPPKERSNSSCNFGLTSLEKRQWSIFLFHVGFKTDFVVYNGEQLVLTIKDPVYGKPPYPALLIDQPMWGQNISMYFSGQIDVLMAIKRGPVGTTTQRSPLSTSYSSTSVIPSGPPPLRPGTKGKGEPMKNVYIGVGAGVGGLLLLLILLAVVTLLLRKRRRKRKRPPVNRSVPSVPLGSLRRNHSANNEDGRIHQSSGTDEDNTTKLRKFQEDSNSNNLNSDEPLYHPLEQVKRKKENNTPKIYAQLTPQVSAEQSKVKLRKGNHTKPKKKPGKRVKSRERGKLDNQSSSLRRQKDKIETVNAECESETIQAENVRTFKNNSPKVNKNDCGSTYSRPTPGTSSAYDYIEVLPDM